MLATVPVLVSTSGKNEIMRDLGYGVYVGYVGLERHCPKGVPAFHINLAHVPAFILGTRQTIERKAGLVLPGGLPPAG